MNNRDVLLDSIRSALADSQVIDGEEDEHSYRVRGESDHPTVVSTFAERVGEYRAQVIRVPAARLPDAMAEQLRARAIRKVVVSYDFPGEWLPSDVDLARDSTDKPLTNEQLDAIDAAVTGCALAIAQTGTIVLDAGARQGRRAMSLLPDCHVCIIDANQIVELVPEAIAALRSSMTTPRPLTFVSGPSATSDIELSRVEGVHGPRTLIVIIVDGALS